MAWLLANISSFDTGNTPPKKKEYMFGLSIPQEKRCIGATRVKEPVSPSSHPLEPPSALKRTSKTSFRTLRAEEDVENEFLNPPQATPSSHPPR